MSAGDVSNVVGSAKRAFNCSKAGDFSGVSSEIGQFVKEIFYFVGFAWSAYEIYNLVQRQDLKRRQKILPIIGLGLTGVAALASGIILCVGATFLLPPLIFVGSVFNVVRNVGLYLKERSERKNLQKQFKKEQEINHKINQLDLPEKLRHDIREFIKLPHLDKHKIQELYLRIGYHFINKTAKEQQELCDLLQQSKVNNLSPKEKSVLRAKIKSKEKALNKRLEKEYGELFTLFEKKQRIHFLKKNIKSRIANIAISAGVAFVSLVTTVLTAVIGATPAAPGAVAVYGAMGGLSIGLSAIGAANAAKMSLQENASKNKVVVPKEQLAKAVYPSLKNVSENSENKKRSDVLYKKSVWAKFKGGIKNAWNRLWVKTPEDKILREKPQTAIQKVIANLVQKEYQSTPLTQEEMSIPKGVAAQRRAHFTSRYNAQDASLPFEPANSVAKSTDKPASPVTPKKM